MMFSLHQKVTWIVCFSCVRSFLHLLVNAFIPVKASKSLHNFSLSWNCLCNRNNTAWVTRVTEIISSYLLEEAGKILDISHQASGAMWEDLLAEAAPENGERSEKEKGLWEEGILFYSVHKNGKHVKGKWCHVGCHGNRCSGSAVAYRWGVSSQGLEDGCNDTSCCPQMHLMHIACICRISLQYKFFYDIFVIVTWKGFTGLITFIGLGFGVNSFLFVDSRDLFFFSILCHSLIL